jgi:serine/threonine-protein kinase HipA
MTIAQFQFQQLDYALDIYAGEQIVARLGLDQSSDNFLLEYARSWIQATNGYALSPYLPFDTKASSHTIRRFLENLLPEGRALDVASVHTNIQKNNIFGLIRHLGRETSGGLTFLPAGQNPKTLSPLARELTLAELQERIDHRNQIPFSVWDGQVRMSIAGFQDKLLVHLHHGRLFLVDGSLSSTHILKPEPTSTALPCMVANEHFCMQLAARISLQRYKQNHVAKVDILRAPSPVLSVQRFDRKEQHLTKEVPILNQDGQSSGKTVNLSLMQRMHIIDGCQASDLSVAAKYERNFGNGKDVAHIRDGASFPKIFGIKAYLETPAVGVQRLVLWAVTTLLFGNSDAHGKNISFHVGRAGSNVAELYDLVSVMQYDASKLEHTLAMAFGDAFELEEVKSFALADFCVRCGISRSFFARELETLCNIALEQSPLQEQDRAYRGPEQEFVKLISSLVTQRATALKAMAKEISHYKSDLF